jgi:hypothetical protein
VSDTAVVVRIDAGMTRNSDKSRRLRSVRHAEEAGVDALTTRPRSIESGSIERMRDDPDQLMRRRRRVSVSSVMQ